jgi:hypothetical protein
MPTSSVADQSISALLFVSPCYSIRLPRFPRSWLSWPPDDLEERAKRAFLLSEEWFYARPTVTGTLLLFRVSTPHYGIGVASDADMSRILLFDLLMPIAADAPHVVSARMPVTTRMRNMLNRTILKTARMTGVGPVVHWNPCARASTKPKCLTMCLGSRLCSTKKVRPMSQNENVMFSTEIRDLHAQGGYHCC